MQVAVVLECCAANCSGGCLQKYYLGYVISVHIVFEDLLQTCIYALIGVSQTQVWLLHHTAIALLWAEQERTLSIGNLIFRIPCLQGDSISLAAIGGVVQCLGLLWYKVYEVLELLGKKSPSPMSPNLF